MLFHHIGIACKNIEDSIVAYTELGYISTEIIFDSIQKVQICFLTKKDSPLIELVGSNDPESPIRNILKKNGTIPYHTCYEVKNIEEEIPLLSSKGFVLITQPIQAIAFSNRRICFLYNKDVGVIELLEC